MNIWTTQSTILVWLLSKLFSVDTLAKAIAVKPGVLACNVTTEEELNAMEKIFEQCATLVRKQVPRYSSEVDENVIH